MNRARIDVDLVHAYLTASYWAEGRSRDVVLRSMKNSICFGAYVDDQQVGFGRCVTDFAVFAYIMDVFVLPEFRNKGIATALVQAIVDHAKLHGVQTIVLRTRDAQAFYEQLGFVACEKSTEIMRYG